LQTFSKTGVKFRSVGDPVLYLSDPPGINKLARRRFLNDLAKLNQLSLEELGDPEISTRISQYEMVYRMQSSDGGLLVVTRLINSYQPTDAI